MTLAGSKPGRLLDAEGISCKQFQDLRQQSIRQLSELLSKFHSQGWSEECMMGWVAPV